MPLPRGGSPQLRNYVWADVNVCGDQTLRMVATHLDPASGQRGTLLRVGQVRRVLQGWGHRRATVILGDLNARPASPEIQLLAEAGLQDAWRVAGGSQADLLTHPPVSRRSGSTTSGSLPTCGQAGWASPRASPAITAAWP